MEDLAGDANDLVEQEESIRSIPSSLFTGTNLNKRLRSKVWDDFIPTFVNGKVTRAECIHCHQFFGGTNGTSSLIRHLTSCIPAIYKRPKTQENTSSPCMQKGKISAGSDLKQKKLPFLPSSQKKCTDTEVTVPERKDLALLDIPMDTNRTNQDVDQNGSHEEPAAPEKKELASLDIPMDTNMMNHDVDQKGSHEEPAAPEHRNLPNEEIMLPEQIVISANTNQKHQEIDQDVDQNGSREEPAAPEHRNLSNGEIMLPEQIVIPANTNQKHQEIDLDASHEEFIEMLAMHGHLPRMAEQDGFRKLVAWLNPTIKMPSHDDVMVNTSNLFQKEKSKLKEELTALHSRFCLSAYMWHYDPVSPFFCLRVHYIDDEWEKQQKIILFRAVDSSCGVNELSDIILGAVEQWGLDGKVFCIILDDAFIDDSVASIVKAKLLERNPLTAKRSLFVVRYATHLLNQVIQVGLDELGKIMEKLSKCSKHTKSLAPSAVQYPNYRYAPSSEDWWTAKKICSILDELHGHVDFALEHPTPAHFFNMAWNVNKDVNFKSYMCKDDDTFSKIQEKMQYKFKECWKVCFFHFCMPMILDPGCRLDHIKSRIWQSDLEKNLRDYMHDVHNTFANLFDEFSDQVEDHNLTSESKTSKEIIVDGDTLVEYCRYHQYQYSEKPVAELDRYLKAPHLTTSEPADLKRTAGKPSATKWWKEPCALQWWKEHSLNYPTIARMARDVLALPCISDWKVATRTATLVISESGSRQWVEELVCTQDWLTPAGMGDEGTNEL